MKVLVSTHTKSTHKCNETETHTHTHQEQTHTTWTKLSPPTQKAWKILTFSSQVTFPSNFHAPQHTHMPPDTHHAARYKLALRVHKNSCLQTRETHKQLQISRRNCREFREWGVILLKRTKLQEMRITGPPLWPNLQSVPEIGWRKKGKQRKFTGEGNVWATINRRPVFEMILKGVQSFIIQLILLHVYHVERVKRNFTGLLSTDVYLLTLAALRLETGFSGWLWQRTVYLNNFEFM